MKNFKHTKLLILAVGSLTAATSAQAGGRLCGWSMKETPPAGPIKARSHTALDEGTEEGLSYQDRERLKDWALNTKLALEQILKDIEQGSMVEKKQTLTTCIENAVTDSAPLTTETLLRYTLNRALAANKTIEEETIRKSSGKFAAGTIDQQVRLMRESIKLALNYYENDLAYVAGKEKANTTRLITPEFAKFGLKYNTLILSLSSSLYDATAQFEILKKSIGWLAKDLSKDALANHYGRIAITLDNVYRMLPNAEHTSDPAAVQASVKAKRSLKHAKELLASVNAELAHAR